MTDLPLEQGQRESFEATWAQPTGLASLTAVNNQVIGKRFMLTAFVFFLLGGLLATLMRTQLAVSDLELIDPDLYNRLFTMHGSTMMYLFAVPFLEGLAVYIVPRMIGSRDLAFPRLTAFGYWCYLFGGIVFYSSWIVGAVPDSGWFAYTPLSGPRFAGTGQDLWLIGLALVEVAGITAAVEIVVTILKLRAPGMSMQRMPVFVWTMLVTGVMIAFAFTVLLTATLLLELDRAAGTRFFDPTAGGSSLLWQHLFWFFGHPEVYIAFLPATGIVSQIVPVAAKRRLVAYELVVVAIILTGFISFGLWVHHMFVAGLPELSKTFFTGASLLIAVASGTQIFSWIATMWGSRPRFDPPLVFVLGFLFIFTLGGMTGVMVAVVPFDAQVHDTYFVVAHFHYVLVGGVVFPILAGLHFWAPNLLGRKLHDKAAHISFWLIFIGFNVTFFPMHIMGYLGLPRRVYTYPAELGLDGYNLLSTVASYVLAIGFLVFAGNFLWAWRRGEETGGNPWDADGLEWAEGSPPPSYGFFVPPRVTGRHALWSEDEPLGPRGEQAREALRGAPHDWRGTLVTEALDATPQAILQLPGPNIAPILVATALLIALVGVLVQSYVLAALAFLVTAVGVGRWLAPDLGYVGRARTSDVGVEGGIEIFPTGSRAVQWWGAIGTCVVLGTGFVAVLSAWAYLWLEAQEWPPAGLSLPSLAWCAPFVLLLVAAPLTLPATTPMRIGNRGVARFWLGFAGVLGLAAAIVHAVLLANLSFSWTEHAFTSAFWTLHGAFFVLQVVFLALIAGVIAMGGRPEDATGPVQVQVASICWGFQGALGVLIFVVVHLLPRILGGAG